MGIKIKLVIPTPVPPQGMHAINRMLECRRRSARPDTTIEVFIPTDGPARLVTLADRFESEASIYPEVSKAASEGYDAVVIDCTCDQLFDEARFVTTVPVVFPMYTALHVACFLGNRFGVITPTRGAAPMFRELIKKYGFSSNVVSVEEAPVDLFSESLRDRARNLFLQASKTLVEAGTDVIILGCTLFTDDRWLAQKLAVPVISPGDVAVKVAEMLAELRNGNAG